MSKNTNQTEMSVSTESSATETISTETTVKSVLAGLYGDFQIDPETHKSSGSFGSRESSGFDRLDRSAKLAVKKAVQARFDRFMRDGAFDPAQALWAVLGTLSGSSTASRSSEVTEESVRSAMAEKVAMLRFAADALFAGSVPVAGYDGLVPILEESDIPDLSDEMVEKALKFASVAFGTKTRENDIPDMLRNVLETYEAGTYVVISAIRNKMAEMYPNKGISSEWDGRVNAALFGPNWDNTVFQPISSKSPEALGYDEKGRAGVYVTIRPESDEAPAE